MTGGGLDSDTKAMLRDHLGALDYENESWDEYWSHQDFNEIPIELLEDCKRQLQLISLGFSKTNNPVGNRVSLAIMLKLEIEIRRQEEKRRQQLRQDLDDSIDKLKTTTDKFERTIAIHDGYIDNRPRDNEEHLSNEVVAAWKAKFDKDLGLPSQERRTLYASRGVGLVEWDGVYVAPRGEDITLVLVEAKSSNTPDFLSLTAEASAKVVPLRIKIERTRSLIQEAIRWTALTPKQKKAETWQTKKEQNNFLCDVDPQKIAVILGYPRKLSTIESSLQPLREVLQIEIYVLVFDPVCKLL